MARMVQGKKVEEALAFLHLLPKKAAKILHKVVHAAQANAVNNAWYSKDNLYIQTIDVGRGAKIKRMRFASRSRAHGYVKHRSFVRVVLSHK